MSTALLIALVGAGATIITGVISWMVSRRTTSGRAGTSDAATLWKAAEQIRGELRNDLVAARDQIDELRERVAILEAEQREYRHCKERVAHLEAEVERLRKGLHNV